jgi:DNA-binding XRE family transcriptional regulator
MAKPSNQLNSLWMARQQAGLRQKSVARLLGHRSTSIISEYETGKLLPSLPTALKLAAIYDCNIRDLYPDLNSTILSQLHLVKNPRSLPIT